MPICKMMKSELLRKIQNLCIFGRAKSSLSVWHEDISTDIKVSIEKHWANEVRAKDRKHNDLISYYVLPMFPYPSGNLHMGHVRVYTISDTIARFHKLNGINAIHPIGWDAFGLPAENAAIERNIAPQKWTNDNIKSMKKQLLDLGYQFDWDREISTCDSSYYKWTQFIFLKLFEQGLAYQSKAMVNWDPVDQTVLADEQVDDMGCSWRSGVKVEKKQLTQWFIKTTKFAKQLYDGLDSKALENWGDIINLQKHWIGECNGVVVTFSVNINGTNKPLNVWTAEPYKLIHGQFLTISKSSVIAQELLDNVSLKIWNPITDSELLIYITDEASYAEGQDVLLACPKWDQGDYELARSLKIPVIEDNSVVNVEKENELAIKIAKSKNVGGHLVSSKLKDWLISRQRYWGTPIPIIHCSKCGVVPVPYKDLPVQLPVLNSSKMQSLSNLNEWVNCKCPNCQSNAKRETDTMDTFVDSSWYYYRFLDPHNDTLPFDIDKVQKNIPVNIYIGGKEHAVLHLYYARFMSYFLHSLGWTSSNEPFKRLLVQGMVMGQSYKVKSTGKYIPPDSVEKVGKDYKEKNTGESVMVKWEKMSKSKYNGENPERLLSLYGCDTTRLLMLADVPPETSRNWSDATLPGVLNWQKRLWMTMRDFINHRNSLPSSNLTEGEFQKYEDKIWEARNYFTATTTFHFKYSYKLSVGISRLQGLTNTLRNNIPPEVMSKSKEFEIALASLIIMLSPVTPHFCSELWAGLLAAPNRVNSDTSHIDWSSNVFNQKWPAIDNDFKLSFQCKVDGADRSDLKIKANDLAKLSQEDAINIMIKEESVAKRLSRGISRTRFELYPECRAILHIYTNRDLKKKKEPVEGI